MYRSNREPLARNTFAALPIGSIRARGWLHTQLRLSAEGLTGHMMEIWPDVGPNSGWLGGPGENWERGPYYVRGLLALAHTLPDENLLNRARPWIEWSLHSQNAAGFFGPADNDDWWPRMPMLDAIRLHHDATRDPRILPFMSRYFHYQAAHLASRPLEGWGKARGADNIASVLWLYNHTGDRLLLESADLLHRQTSDWLEELNREAPSEDSFEFGHGVNRAMGFKAPAVCFQRSGDPRYLAALRTGWQQTLLHHGQIQGMFSADEFLHGTGSTQGTELCTIVELLSSFYTALEISGEPWLADAIERIAYNALPSILSADHRGHQYFQLPNQIECTPGGRNFRVHHENDLLFGPATGYGCCAANLHMGWPQLISNLWMATSDHGLAALLFAPCEVTAVVGDGQTVSITEDTRYPFGDQVRFVVRTADPIRFPLSIRIPAWARSPAVAVNGTAVSLDRSGALVTVSRTWHDSDELTLELRPSVRLSRWERGSIGVERGALVYALRIGEVWRKVGGTDPFGDYEVHPTTPWNYGLELDPTSPEHSFHEVHGAAGEQPWAQDGSPIRLETTGRRIPEWKLEGGASGPIPETDLSPNTARETITLIPFGCARLRISMFPVLK